MCVCISECQWVWVLVQKRVYVVALCGVDGVCPSYEQASLFKWRPFVMRKETSPSSFVGRRWSDTCILIFYIGNNCVAYISVFIYSFDSIWTVCDEGVPFNCLQCRLQSHPDNLVWESYKCLITATVMRHGRQRTYSWSERSISVVIARFTQAWIANNIRVQNRRTAYIYSQFSAFHIQSPARSLTSTHSNTINSILTCSHCWHVHSCPPDRHPQSTLEIYIL